MNTDPNMMNAIEDFERAILDLFNGVRRYLTGNATEDTIFLLAKQDALHISTLAVCFDGTPTQDQAFFLLAAGAHFSGTVIPGPQRLAEIDPASMNKLLGAQYQMASEYMTKPSELLRFFLQVDQGLDLTTSTAYRDAAIGLANRVVLMDGVVTDAEAGGVQRVRQTLDAWILRPTPASTPAGQQSTVLSPPAHPPSWFPDPLGRHELRFWDGERWSSAVLDAGAPGSDPIP